MPETPAVVSVHLLPSLIPPGALKGGVAVVIDVLRATTVMIHALAAGCEAIIPCGEVDGARNVAASLPPGSVLLGGERGGLPIPGFDLDSSPSEYTQEVCHGKTLVITTTNGTKAIMASPEAERVLIGAFVNLDAVARASRGCGLPIHIVCSGTEGFVSWEDTLCAGAIIEKLGGTTENDEARIAREAWLSVLGSIASDDKIEVNQNLAWRLSQGRGGGNVQRIGLRGDILYAADLNRFDFAPRLQHDPLRITSSNPPGS